MAFEKNKKNIFKVGDEKTKLVQLASGMISHETKIDIDEEDNDYYGEGKVTDVMSYKLAYVFSCHRQYSDDGQEYVRNKLFKSGKDADCFFEVTEADERVISGPATIKLTKISGGDASKNSDFEFEITFRGTPTDTPKTAGK